MEDTKNLILPVLRSLLRHGLTAGAVWLVAHGLIGEHDAGELVGQVTELVIALSMAGGGIAWSVQEKRKPKPRKRRKKKAPPVEP